MQVVVEKHAICECTQTVNHSCPVDGRRSDTCLWCSSGVTISICSTSRIITISWELGDSVFVPSSLATEMISSGSRGRIAHLSPVGDGVHLVMNRTHRSMILGAVFRGAMQRRDVNATHALTALGPAWRLCLSFSGEALKSSLPAHPHFHTVAHSQPFPPLSFPSTLPLIPCVEQL
jgi:hypothetical protein